MILLIFFITLFLSTYLIFKFRTATSTLKKPIILETPKVEIQEPKHESLCPFVIFNGFQMTKRTKKIVIPKGTEITKNFYILNGTVGVFYKGKRMSILGENEMTFTPFDILGIPIGTTKKTLTDVICYELPVGNSFVNLKYLEKLVFEPILRLCKETSIFVNLETQKTKHFENFLIKNFNLCGYTPETVVVKGDFVLDECLYFVESGELEINGVLLGNRSIFGYFGAFFNFYKGFTCKAKEGTVLKQVPYSKLKNGIFDVRTLKDMPYCLLLMGITAKWTLAQQGTAIYLKGEQAENLFLVDGTVHGCKEAVLNTVFEKDLLAEKSVDVIKIPSSTVDELIRIIPHFFKELTNKMFELPKIKSKIVLITPAKEESQLFHKRLARTLLNDAVFLKNKNIVEMLGKNVFFPVGELILSEHLKKLSEKYKVVVVFLENEFSRLVNIVQNFCDIVFIVGDVNTMNWFKVPNVELISLFEKRTTKKNKTVSKIKNRLLTDFSLTGLFDDSSSDEEELNRTNQLVDPLESTDKKTDTNICRFRRVHPIMSPKEMNFCNKDFERFSRYLKGERFGLVLGGGGARGYAHIGVIRALEEENIPIDVVGGTSMGALVGALYSRELDYMEVYRQSKKLSKLGASVLHFLLDFTYPFISLLSGNTMRSSLRGIFKNQQIQNFWLEYFCVSTDLRSCSEKVFFNGSASKCIRSSMSVAGLVPPVFYQNMILCDGAYVNNVPIDVMRKMEVKNIIAVRVDQEFSDNIEDLDSRSGLMLLIKSFLFKKNYLSLTETQYRLSFLKNAMKQKNLNENDFCIQPDLSHFKVSDFHKFEEIIACGYVTAKMQIKEWKRLGKIGDYKKVHRRYTL